MTIKEILQKSVCIYSNALLQKESILEDNREKSGWADGALRVARPTQPYL
jgi:hypothetical protein